MLAKKASFYLWSALALVLVGAICMGAGCTRVTNPATQQEEIIFFNDSQETSIGEAIASDIETQYHISQNPVYNQRVNRIGQQLVAVCERSNLPFQFKVIQTDQINAFALPGGFIYVYEGLLDNADDEELAGVLGHEIGHITARHGIKKLQNNIGYGLLIDLLLGDDPTTRGIADTAYSLVILGYSRSNEFEADKLSVAYSHRAGLSPRGMERFLQKIYTLEEREPSAIEILVSTHPPTSERIERVTEEILRIQTPSS